MKINILSVVLLATFFMTSCSESLLDIPQKGVVSIDDFYLTEEDAESAISAAYSEMAKTVVRGIASGMSFNYSPYITLFNLPSDDIYAAGSNRGDNDFLASINEFRYTTDNEVIKTMYRGFYAGIYASNLVIKYYGERTGESNAIARYVAEARVLRAWAHMMLAIGWGTPPLIDKVLVGSERPENTKPGELLEWVISEFEAAVAYIPSRASKDDKEGAVRLTKEAVYAFLGKAQVQAGQYAAAAQNLKNYVINSGKYELVPGEEMFGLFHQSGDGSSEKVFEFNVVGNANVSWFSFINLTPWQQTSVWNWRHDKFTVSPPEVYQTGWGGCNPTGEFAEALIANDGFDSHRRKAWFKTYDEVLYELAYPTDSKFPTQAEKATDPNRGVDPNGTGLYGHEGYFMWKRLAMTAEKFPQTSVLFENNFVIMRYAEVLLLYAEACVQSGTDLAGGLEALNSIQRRAGSDYISPALTLEDVKNEKRYEMWLEGTRWADLVRWGDAATVLKNNGKRSPTFTDLFKMNSAGVVTTPHTGYVDWSDADTPYSTWGYKPNKHELFPFPFGEVSVNKNLDQNPGW